MISQGVDPDTLEIRFTPEMSGLLPGFLGLLSPGKLECVVELQQNDAGLPQTGENAIQTNKNATETGDSPAQGAENPEHMDANPEQVSENVSGKTIFYPLLSIKSDNHDNIQKYFITLEFEEDQFKNVMKSISLMNNGSSERKSPFKELRIDYTHSLDSKRYPVLCFPCKYQ
ncbi:MAG: hypothetical protein HQK61_11550 [Desulfamplus sp.]|nr:hypothetical protein [Desulfamplus sp.]